MVWALILSLLLLCPVTALAEEEGQVSVVAAPDPIEEKLDGIDQSIDDGFRTLQQTLQDHYQQESNKQELDAIDDDSDRQLELLSNIDTNVTKLVAESETGVAESLPLESRAVSQQFVCYASSPVSGTYYQYALGMAEKVGFEDNYCFIQDSQSSYVFVFGSIESDGNGTLTGDDCEWHRWYNAGLNQGWVHQSGNGQISVTTQGYTIFSDLEWWPSLPSSEPLRREVMLYALVAVTVFILDSVWSYTLRNRNGTT